MKTFYFFMLAFFSVGTLLSQTQMGSDLNGDEADTFFGSSVAITASGNRIVVGAENFEYNDSGNIEGLLRVFDWNGVSWNQVGSDLLGDGKADFLGHSVSISSDGLTIAGGAVQNLGFGLEGNGYANIYRWNGNDWQQLGDKIVGTAIDDEFGASLSLSSSGNRIIIGGPRNNNVVGLSAGHAKVFDWNGTSWSQVGTDINGGNSGDSSGRSVSMSGDGSIVAIGSPGNSNSNGNYSGHVRVFKWENNSWNQLGMAMEGEAAADYSGTTISISQNGNVVAIGAQGNDGNGDQSGHARIYYWDGNTWIKRGKDIDGEAALDQSGQGISISGDGKTVAIGARSNDGTNTGNANVGHVRIFQWTGNDWLQIGEDIESGETLGGLFGSSVAISSDASTVVIGAPANQTNGSQAGQVQVYDLSNIISSTAENTSPKFSTFPNPATEFMTVEGLAKIDRIEIFNLDGKLRKSIRTNVSQINVSDLYPGFYFLKIFVEDQVMLTSFVKI